MKKLITLLASLFLLTSISFSQITTELLLTPTSGAAGVDIDAAVTFDWDDYLAFENDATTEDDYYLLKIGTSAGASDLYSTTPSTLTLSTEDVDLGAEGASNNTLYYWEVEVYDDGVLEGTYSGFTLKTELQNGQITIDSEPTGTTVPVAGQSVQFDYNHVGSASTVTIEIKLNGGTVQTYAGLSASLVDQVYNFSTLAEGTVYTLDIVVTNDDKGSDTYTTAGTGFTTLDFPGSITEDPTDGVTVTSIAPTFNYVLSNAATDYSLQVNSQADMLGTDYWNGSIGTTGTFQLSSPLTPMFDNTTYYWEITYVNSGGGSQTYGPYSFTTPQQTLATPADGATGVATSGATSVTLSWDAIPGTDQYQINFGTTSGALGFSSALINDPITSVSVVNGGGHTWEYNTTYYWEVESRNNSISNNGDSPLETSDEYEFTTEIATPVMTAPTGYDGSRTPTAEWTFAGGTTGVTFDVEYRVVGAGSWLTETTGLVGTSTSHVFTTTLDYNTDYEIRVVAIKAGEADKAAVATTFKTLLPTPTSVSPLTANTVEVAFGNDINLDWSIPAATTTTDIVYDVWIGPTGSATEVVSNQTHATGTEYDYDTGLTTALGIHDWWVVIQDNGGAGGENTEVSTFASLQQYEVLFGLVTPINSLSGVSLTPLFEWDDAGGLVTGTDFDIEIDDDPAFGSINYTIDASTASLNAGTWSYQSKESDYATPMSNNSKYYWRVKDNTNTYKSVTYYFYTVDDITVSLANPSNGTEVYLYDPLQFTWYLSQAQGSLRFLLQIKDTTAAPGAHEWENYSDFEYDHINSIYRSVNGLSGGTRYFWRIVAYFDDGAGTSGSFDWGDRVVKYSSVFYFDTKGGAVTAYPSWPVGGNLIYNLTPTFYWYTLQYEPSATYEVYYSTSGANTGGILDTYTAISAGSNIFVSVGTSLLPSQDYYWQVKTTYGSEVKYSSIAEFTIYDAPGLVPTAATPSYPTGGVEIYTQSPTFYWYIEGYNVDVNFTVEVDDDPGFGSINFSFGTTQSTYIQGSGLVPGTNYHWRVRSSKSGYTDVLGPTATFSVAGGLGTSVVLSWPVGNPTVWSATPTLSWYLDGSSLGWSNYIVRWKAGSTSSDWASDYDGTYSTSDINETFYTFTSTLDYGETYYWAVALYDGSTPVVDADFAESSFTIAGGAGSAGIVQTMPANNSINVGLSPSFYWYVSGSSLGIDKYKVTYSNTELFTANVVELETTSTYVSAGSLDPGTTYWWYVSVSYDAGSTYTVASPTWKFTTDAGASAVMPLVGSPTNGTSVSTNAPVLSWYLPAQSSSTLSYEVELADNAEFNNAVVYSDISSLNAQAEALESGEYFWRVKSKAGNSDSHYSNTGKFKIGDGVTAVDDEEKIPLTYSIDQNYPNPFNPATTIRYSLPENTFVSIKIYDMLGQEVKTLISQEMKSGKHTLNWNGKNNYGYKVSSGTYIYRISAGNFIETKKMVLLK